MSDYKFAIEVTKVLHHIAYAIEEHDKACNYDIDISDDTLTLYTKEGTYVINKQSAIKEIWLSSPVSGPHHFISNNGQWKTRGDVDLFILLSQELQIPIIPIPISAM